MVHREEENYEFDSLLVFRNVPFSLIPRGLIEQIRERDFTYEKYLKCCSMMDQSGVYWNILVTNNEEALGVVWGSWDILEGHLRIIRLSIAPIVKSFKGSFLHYLLRQVQELASSLQAGRCFWESKQWRAWLKLLDGYISADDIGVLSII
jgi:hypothetical protein